MIPRLSGLIGKRNLKKGSNRYISVVVWILLCFKAFVGLFVDYIFWSVWFAMGILKLIKCRKRHHGSGAGIDI